MQVALQLDDSTEGWWTPQRVDTIPSLIKWTGSKRSQAPTILKLMPRYRRYIEPFVGGGAILYAAAVPGSIASDVYGPLVELWRIIQSDPRRVIENYKTQWGELNAELDGLDLNNLQPGESLPVYFYHVRDRFNQKHDPLDLNFIMRTCVNGIVRFSAKGAFNNSFHLSRRGMEPARFEKIVMSWQQSIRGVDFLCHDYELSLEHATSGDFVYLDPPYAANKQRYAEDLDLGRFFSALERLNQKGAKWALSFDGKRGTQDLVHDVPKSLFKRHLFLSSGLSAVNKVLNGPIESVQESLYLNY
ncbi:MAG TPA: Dam family site-specific DNA-(adenine-N6)-methyltransferase [Rhizomicrobium sp.]|jgi:DNA adenine methylase|nr:Dam family site-specific DNA-(adenine-N6)-methyltransferase [Rhizomicrobium sp.]